MSKTIDVWVGRQTAPNPDMPPIYCDDDDGALEYYSVDGEVMEYMFGGPDVHWKRHTVEVSP